VFLPPALQTPESVLATWDAICDTTDQCALEAGFKQTEKFLSKAAASFGNQ
jgi:hypothetical protein